MGECIFYYMTVRTEGVTFYFVFEAKMWKEGILLLWENPTHNNILPHNTNLDIAQLVIASVLCQSSVLKWREA